MAVPSPRSRADFGIAGRASCAMRCGRAARPRFGSPCQSGSSSSTGAPGGGVGGAGPTGGLAAATASHFVCMLSRYRGKGPPWPPDHDDGALQESERSMGQRPSRTGPGPRTAPPRPPPLGILARRVGQPRPGGPVDRAHTPWAVPGRAVTKQDGYPLLQVDTTAGRTIPLGFDLIRFSGQVTNNS